MKGGDRYELSQDTKARPCQRHRFAAGDRPAVFPGMTAVPHHAKPGAVATSVSACRPQVCAERTKPVPPITPTLAARAMNGGASVALRGRRRERRNESGLALVNAHDAGDTIPVVGRGNARWDCGESDNRVILHYPQTARVPSSCGNTPDIASHLAYPAIGEQA